MVETYSHEQDFPRKIWMPIYYNVIEERSQMHLAQQTGVSSKSAVSGDSRSGSDVDSPRHGQMPGAMPNQRHCEFFTGPTRCSRRSSLWR